MSRYKIQYNMKGGKPFDYLFYRIVNSFIEDKFEAIEIVNNFPNGIVSDEDIQELIRRIPKINEINKELKEENILDISREVIENDKRVLTAKNIFLNQAELDDIISQVPNIETNLLDYLQYLLTLRSHNIDKDKFEYLKIQSKNILEKIYTEKKIKESDDKLKILRKQILSINGQIEKINDRIKEKPLYLSLKGSIKKKVGEDVFVFTSNEQFSPDIVGILQTEIIFISTTQMNSLDCDTIVKIRIVKHDAINFEFLVLDQEPDFAFVEKELDYGLGIRACGFVIKNREELERKEKDKKLVEKQIDKLEILNDKTVIYNNTLLSTLDCMNILYKLNSEDSAVAKDTGETYEKLILFLSILNICNSLGLDINSIRIKTNLVLKDKSGEIDILILNQENKIVALGEVKSFIDGIHKAYNQLNKFKKKLKTKRKLTFIDSEGIDYDIKLNDDIIVNDVLQDNQFLFICLKNSNLINLDSKSITKLLIKLYENDGIIINYETKTYTKISYSFQGNKYHEYLSDGDVIEENIDRISSEKSISKEEIEVKDIQLNDYAENDFLINFTPKITEIMPQFINESNFTLTKTLLELYKDRPNLIIIKDIESAILPKINDYYQ